MIYFYVQGKYCFRYVSLLLLLLLKEIPKTWLLEGTCFCCFVLVAEKQKIENKHYQKGGSTSVPQKTKQVQELKKNTLWGSHKMKKQKKQHNKTPATVRSKKTPSGKKKKKKLPVYKKAPSKKICLGRLFTWICLANSAKDDA